MHQRAMTDQVKEITGLLEQFVKSSVDGELKMDRHAKCRYLLSMLRDSTLSAAVDLVGAIEKREVSGGRAEFFSCGGRAELYEEFSAAVREELER